MNTNEYNKIIYNNNLLKLNNLHNEINFQKNPL